MYPKSLTRARPLPLLPRLSLRLYTGSAYRAAVGSSLGCGSANARAPRRCDPHGPYPHLYLIPNSRVAPKSHPPSDHPQLRLSLLLSNTTRTTSGPPSTRATAAAAVQHNARRHSEPSSTGVTVTMDGARRCGRHSPCYITLPY